MTDAHIARRMWTRFEPIHAVVYFTPEARAAFEAAGLRGYWRGYFGGRAAPLGTVDAPAVIASFYTFAPVMVGRAIPDVWTRATPAEALNARLHGATDALTRILADQDPATLAEAADLADVAVSLLDPAGRPLGATNAALSHDPQAPPLVRLWQATTTLREHRGDGHVAALVAYGFDACESVVWRCAPSYREDMQRYRGWTDEEWEAATERLTERGWLDESGRHTPAGDDAYQAVEAATDREAGRVWRLLGPERTERLRDLLTPAAVVAHAGFSSVNPMGVPNPATF